MARILPIPDPATLGLAIQALRRGEAVAIPTETVYGLAADATNAAAIASTTCLSTHYGLLKEPRPL